MKKYIGPVLAGLFGVMLILTAAFWSPAEPGDGDASQPEDQTSTVEDLGAEKDQPQEPEEPEEPPLTLEMVRTAAFADVPSGDAAADYISYAAYQGLLAEVEEGLFAPESWITGADLALALSRTGEEDAPSASGSLIDALETGEGEDPVRVVWVKVREAETGETVEDAYILLDDDLDRARMAQILYRYAGDVELLTDRFADLDAYRDGDTVPEDAKEAVAWVVANNLYDGMVSDAICPNLPVDRAQLAQVLVELQAMETEEPVAVELAAALSPKSAASVSQSQHEDIQTVVDAVASKYGAVGLQVAVVENGQVTDTYTYGWATKGSVPMTDDHKIRVASITKVAVGMSAMLLREQGIIDLDDDISDYWGVSLRNPSYPDIPITFRALLSHTSSILPREDASRTRGAYQSQLSGSGYSRVQPGNIYSWIYNNHAFGALGVTLELASGQFLDEIMEENIWSYLDIDAAFESGSVQNTDKLAGLYYHDGSSSRSAQAQLGIVRPDAPGSTGVYFAGGLTISAKDLAKMVALLANDGCYDGVRLMGEESVELMETYNEVKISEGFYQALPLRYQTEIYGRDRLYYHTGSAYGVYNCMSYDPDTGDGVVVLTVGASAAKDGNDIYAVCGEISRYIYDTIQAGGAAAAE